MVEKSQVWDEMRWEKYIKTNFKQIMKVEDQFMLECDVRYLQYR